MRPGALPHGAWHAGAASRQIRSDTRYVRCPGSRVPQSARWSTDDRGPATHNSTNSVFVTLTLVPARPLQQRQRKCGSDRYLGSRLSRGDASCGLRLRTARRPVLDRVAHRLTFTAVHERDSGRGTGTREPVLYNIPHADTPRRTDYSCILAAQPPQTRHGQRQSQRSELGGR